MFARIVLFCGCATIALGPGCAFAQQAGTEIEELVVTAEKREQSLQDVPGAISAFTDKRRERVGINSVQDLTDFTPGLAYATNNDRLALRGIGRFTNNRSSDGGVAVYSDGFYTSTVTVAARSTLFIERTEVLRGPQGTLYGRNAIGGALNVISKRPTDSFHAEARLGLGNYGTRVYEAATSGPLAGTVRGRVAGSYSHVDDGALRNLNPNGLDEGGRGTFWNVEGQLDGSLGEGKLEWFLKADAQEWHTLGRGPGGRTTATYGLRDNTTPLIGALTPNSAAFGLSNQATGASCQFCFDTDDGNYIDLENNGYTLNATLHLDTFDVKYIAGYSYYNGRMQTDLDNTSRQAPFLLPVPVRNPLTGAVVPGQTANLPYFPRQHNKYDEEVSWFSNELNIASTMAGPVQWLFGVYQYREGSNFTNSDARYPDDARFATPTTQTGAPAALNPLRRYAYGSAENVTETYAGYGQVDWQATQEFKLTAGLRYTYDRKQSFESARLLCLYTASCPISTLTGRPVDVTDSAAAPNTVAGRQYDPSVRGGTLMTDPVTGLSYRANAVYTDPTTGLRHRLLQNHWSGVTGTLGLDWQPAPDTLVYAKYTRGYKAGGFNSGTFNLTQFITTEEENINAYEVGLKKIFDGKLQINASAFYYDYRDIQVPTTSFNTAFSTTLVQFVNLPKARMYGLEVETVWQPIDNLQILANYAYLNTKILDACCFQDSEDPRGLQPGAQLAGNLSPLPPTGALNQDLRGGNLPSATPHRITVNANYTWEFGAGRLSASANYIWRDATYYSIFKRYYNKAKSYDLVDLRVIYNDNEDKYTMIAYMKNVFDTAGTASISGTRISTGPNTGFINQTVSYVAPRTYGVELQRRF
jgi:iron complex outermembrane receptor protein